MTIGRSGFSSSCRKLVLLCRTLFHVSLLGPAEHVSFIVYFILLVVFIAVVVVAVGGAAGTIVTVEQISVSVTANMVAEFVEDGIEALPFPLLKRSTLCYQTY